MRTNLKFRGVAILSFGLLCVLALISDGCKKTSSASSSDAGPQSAASPVSLPEFYGIFAVDGGKPVAIHQNADQDFSPHVQLVIFAKSVAAGKTPNRLFSIPWSGSSMRHPEGQFSWDQVGADEIVVGMLPKGAVGTTLPSVTNAVGPVLTHVKPIDGHADMIQVVPEQPLQPGLYRFEADAQFWVGRDEVQKQLVAKMQEAMEARRWRDAAKLALDCDSISGKVNTPESKTNVLFAKASQAAKDAAAQNRWDEVAEPSQVALGIRADADLQKLSTDIAYLKPAKAAREALAAKQWVMAAASATEALRVRNNDPEMQMIVDKARSGAATNDAKNALASGRYDQALVAARAGLWMQPEDAEMASLISQASYQQGLAWAKNGLESNDLDAAFDGAEEAVAHKPDSQEAIDLLTKVRAAISTSRTYFGRHFVPISEFKVGWSILRIHSSQDGKTFFAVDVNKVKICDPAGKTSVVVPEAGNIVHAFAPANGPFIFIRGESRIDASGNVLWTAQIPRGKLKPLNISPDGRLIACIGEASGLLLLDSATGVTTAQPDIKVVANSSNDADSLPEVCGGFSKDGKLAAYRGVDGAWNIVGLQNGQVVHSFPCDPKSVSAAGFGGDNLFAYASGEQISVLTTTDWQTVTSINLPGGIFTIHDPLKISSDGKILIAYGRTGGLRLFNPVTGDPIGKPLGNNDHYVSPDGSVVIVHAGQGYDAYRTSDGSIIGKISPTTSPERCTFTPDGGLLIVVGGGVVELWSRPTWADAASLRSLTPHKIVDQANLFDPETRTRANAAIAKIKQQFGIDVIMQVNPGMPTDLPVRADLAAKPDTIFTSWVTDKHATESIPGFYVLVTRYPSNVTWREFPAATGELLNPDQIKALGTRLDGILTSGDPAQTLNQFVHELGRDLQEAHPEMVRQSSSPEAGAGGAPVSTIDAASKTTANTPARQNTAVPPAGAPAAANTTYLPPPAPTPAPAASISVVPSVADFDSNPAAADIKGLKVDQPSEAFIDSAKKTFSSVTYDQNRPDRIQMVNGDNTQKATALVDQDGKVYALSYARQLHGDDVDAAFDSLVSKYGKPVEDGGQKTNAQGLLVRNVRWTKAGALTPAAAGLSAQIITNPNAKEGILKILLLMPGKHTPLKSGATPPTTQAATKPKLDF